MTKRLKNLYTKMIILAIIILAYFIILQYLFKDEKVYKDPLNKKRFYIPFYGKISGWPLSHIIAYIIFTYQYPEYWYHIIFLGIIWEIIEYFFKLLSTKKNKKLKFKRTRNDNNEIEYTTWWDSSTQDIVWNSLGGIIGIGLSRIFKK